jgi:hypothetical protein
MAAGYTWTDTMGPVKGSAYDLLYVPALDQLYRGTGGVEYYDQNADEWRNVGDDAISSYRVYSLAWDGSCLYAGTSEHGVWRYDPKNELLGGYLGGD